MSSNDNPDASTTGQLLLPALHHAFSGSSATLISTCTLYPLSQVIARLQAQRQLRREGKLAPAAAVHGPDPPSPLEDRTQPQQHLRGQQQQREREYTGIVDAFRQIWSSGGDGGLRAFYTGLVPDAARSALDSFLFFLFYEWFRGARLARRGVQARRHATLGALEELAIGVVAGACAKALTTPIANIASRKEASDAASSTETAPGELNLRDIVAGIRRDKGGIAGLWSGYSANLLLTLNPSITFFLQELLKGRVSEKRGREPGAGMNFLLSATSKAVSTLVTYPLQVARTRLQAGIPIELPIDPEPPRRPRQASVEISPTDTVTNSRDRDLDREAERRQAATRAAQRFARQGVLATAAQLARSEGAGALYAGLGGELLGGFLGHGATMVVKEVMHRLLLRFYFFALGVLAEIRQRRAGRRGGGGGEDGGQGKGKGAPEEVPRDVDVDVDVDVSHPPAPEIGPPEATGALTETPVPPAVETASSSSVVSASEHSSSSTTSSTPVSTPAPAPAPATEPFPLLAVPSPVPSPAPSSSLPPSSLPVPVPASTTTTLTLPIPTIPLSQISPDAPPSRVVNPSQIRGAGQPSRIPLPLPKPVSSPQEIPAGLRYRLEWDESRRQQQQQQQRGTRRGTRRGTIGVGGADYGVNVVANLIDGTHRGLGGRGRD